jgi:hypothetical protein
VFGGIVKRLTESLVPKLAEGLMITLLILIAAVWDALISPEWNGTPIPLLLFTVVLLLVVFAPWRWYR